MASGYDGFTRMQIQDEVLLLGIKRNVWRHNDPKALQADAEFKVKRPAFLEKARYVCAACKWRSNRNQVHHRNNNHHDNREENYACRDVFCHAYEHTGEPSKTGDANNPALGASTAIAYIPEVEASDLNLLQRAIGAVLADEATSEEEKAIALDVLKRFHARIEPAAKMLGSAKPVDLAAGMAQLSNDEYDRRGVALRPMRLLFNIGLLKREGGFMKQEYPGVPISSWPAVAAQIRGRE